MTDGGRILMCRPTQFDVQYVINPWMEGHLGRVRHAVAMQQWTSLHAAVSRLAKVEVINSTPACPTCALPPMRGLCWATSSLPVHFASTSVSRRHRSTHSGSNGPALKSLTRWWMHFEGEGDALLQADGESGPRLWAGYGVRSSLESHQAICETLHLEVVSLHLVDERFYHLDTCFAAGRRPCHVLRAGVRRDVAAQIRSRVRADQR